MSQNRDYYEVLGVSKNATNDELKRAFHKLSMLYHPDRQVGKSDSEKKEAEDKFKEIAEAYEVLSNKDKRAQYDQFGFNNTNRFGGQGPDDLAEFFRKHSGFGSDFVGGFGDFGFNPFGGRNNRKDDPNAPKDGQDIKININISFEESIYGGIREFDIRLQDPCDHCHGSGSDDGKTENCQYCDGTGMITQRRGMMIMQSTCPHCNGTGSKIKTKCHICHGSGHVDKPHHIKIEIPMGINSGSTLRVDGAGQHGTNGGRDGDVYVDIYVEDSNIFIRDGMNLIINEVISPITASIGGKHDTITPWGEVTLTIPPETKTGKMLRIKGNGVKYSNGGQCGDLLVRIIVGSLSNLSNEQKKILENLASSLKDDNIQDVKEFKKLKKEYMTKNRGKMK